MTKDQQKHDDAMRDMEDANPHLRQYRAATPEDIRAAKSIWVMDDAEVLQCRNEMKKMATAMQCALDALDERFVNPPKTPDEKRARIDTAARMAAEWYSTQTHTGAKMALDELRAAIPAIINEKQALFAKTLEARMTATADAMTKAAAAVGEDAARSFLAKCAFRGQQEGGDNAN